MATGHDLSPPIHNKKGKFANQKLPKISKAKGSVPLKSGPNFILRNSHQQWEDKRGSNMKMPSPYDRSKAAHYLHPVSSVMPPYQMKEDFDPYTNKFRTHTQIVKDLEKQLGFTYAEN